MSVLNYLENLACNAILSDNEKSSIETSINALRTRLDNYFGSDLSGHFQFGSSTRGTILPRKMDEESDIDYMIIFKDNTYKPQTYLDKLKKFAEKYYSASIVAQSNPAIVIELQHIKFELVPALKYFFDGQYKIPDKTNSYREWIETSPNGFNGELTKKNQDNNCEIKRLIRLVKYWNAINRPSFYSYELEQNIINSYYYGCKNLKEYFYNYMENFSTSSNYSNNLNSKIIRMHNIIARTKEFESQGYLRSAEDKIKELLPEV